MKKLSLSFVILALLLGSGSAQRPSSSGFNIVTASSEAKYPARSPDAVLNPAKNAAGLKVDFGGLPLYFTANEGQVDAKALFYAKASRYTLWLTREGLVFDSFKTEEKAAPDRIHGPALRPERPERQAVKRDVSRLVFLGANKDPQVVPVDETALKVNYFIGNDPAKWHTDILTSAAVLYKDVYDKIDLKVYGVESRIEYDWIVRPGGNPADIRFKYDHVKGTRIDKDGNLLVETSFGELMHKKPEAYQRAGHIDRKDVGDGQRSPILSAFTTIGRNAFGFEVGAYDLGRELVVDPVILAYSTYLGGSGSERATGIAVDHCGNVYVTGSTESTDFPTLNPFQSYRGNNAAVFISKIDTTKSGIASLVYSTYLGGNSSESSFGISSDANGNVYVAGSTLSTDFPTLSQYQMEPGGGWDAFVTKLDTTLSGSASLKYSTYLGGNGETWGFGIASDEFGNAYVTGYTLSTNFPVLNQFQTYKGDLDAFVTKLDTTLSGGACLKYSTCLGGNNYEQAFGITIDDSGCVYVVGGTYSLNFPMLNAFQASHAGGFSDAFLTKIDPKQNGEASLVYSTYLGGSELDYGCRISVDGNSNAYVTGWTGSTNFPTLNQYQSDQGGDDAFVSKIDTSKSGLASLAFSTYLGGTSYDYGRGIAVDGNGFAYVSGITYSADFPAINEYQTYQGGFDVFVAKFDTGQSGGGNLIYSTYLGGSGWEGWHSGSYAEIAVDAAGRAYIAGLTDSADYPVKNQYQSDMNLTDVFVTMIVPDTDIALAKSADNITPKVGETFHYTVMATNNGPMDASGLLVLDLLPSGISCQSSNPSQGTYAAGTGIWNVGALANGASATLTLSVIGTQAGAISNTASVSSVNESDPNPENDSASVTVTLIQIYTIAIESDPGGTTQPPPGEYSFEDGASVSVLAAPSPGNEFAGWIGDASGLTNPITVVADRDKTIRATFARVVKPPLGLTGQKLTNRNVSSVEYVARLTWQPNGANPEPITYRIYRIGSGLPALIGQAEAGATEFIVRGLAKSMAYRFGVAAVNAQGWESDMAEVVVQ